MYYFLKDDRPGYTLPAAVDHHRYAVGSLPVTCFMYHNHDIFEMLSVRRGELRLTLNGEIFVLGPGDIAVICPYDLHQGECARGELEYLGVTINLQTMLPYARTSLAPAVTALLSGRARFDPVLRAASPHAALIADASARLESALEDKSPAGECASAAILLDIFARLFQNHYHETDLPLRGQRDKEFLRTVSQYLFEQYAQDISTRSVCEYLHMPMPQFCRKFRSHFGAPFSNYLCRYRVTMAADVFRGSELPVSQIALTCGFSDYCYFSKSFKKYVGQSPAVYFRRWKST